MIPAQIVALETTTLLEWSPKTKKGARYRVQKVVQPTRSWTREELHNRPFIVIYEITRACNLACIHCRAEVQPCPHPLELRTVALVTSPLLLIAGVMLIASSGGLMSRLAGPRQQGLVGGASQSVQSLAMSVGPLIGGLLYERLGHALPYWSGTLSILLAIIVVALVVPALRTSQALSCI